MYSCDVRDIEFQQQLLGIPRPWRVEDVVVDRPAKTVETRVVFDGPASCPICERPGPKHDHRERRFRHLDLYEYRAYVLVRVPRVDCTEHGVQQLPVPWADGRTGFTALFERLVISLIKEMSLSAVAKIMRLSWSEVDTIMRRAVQRGFARRKAHPLWRIGIDEKSVKKRHVYFTIVTDLERDEVVWVGRGRKKETLDAFWMSLSAEERAGIEGIAMDMHEPYFLSTLAHVPDAAKKIVFDRFHVMMHLTRAVDETRRALMRQRGMSGLKHTRQLWLYAKRNLDAFDQALLDRLAATYRRIGVAWSQKEQFAEFWSARTIEAAKAFFEHWKADVLAALNPPMMKALRMIEHRLTNLLTYITMPITNAGSEGINSRIQMVKFRSRGFRNIQRFERAIYFHLGGLDMNPAT